MTILCALTYTDPSGERRALWEAPPRCASTEEIAATLAPHVKHIQRGGGTDLRLAVVDDVTAACVMRVRIKENNNADGR